MLLLPHCSVCYSSHGDAGKRPGTRAGEFGRRYLQRPDSFWEGQETCGHRVWEGSALAGCSAGTNLKVFINFEQGALLFHFAPGPASKELILFRGAGLPLWNLEGKPSTASEGNRGPAPDGGRGWRCGNGLQQGLPAALQDPGGEMEKPLSERMLALPWGPGPLGSHSQGH